MIAIARRDVPGVDFQVGDFNALPFEDGAFDAIISSHALLFADDRTAALRRMAASRAPVGACPCPCPAPRTTPRHPVRGLPRPRCGAHIRLPEAAELAGWARDAGWTDTASIRISIRRHSPARCRRICHLAPHRLAGCSDRGLERGAARPSPRTCWRSRPGSLTEPTPSVRAIYLIARNGPAGGQGAGLAGVLHAGSREGQHRAHCVVVHPIESADRSSFGSANRPPDRADLAGVVIDWASLCSRRPRTLDHRYLAHGSPRPPGPRRRERRLYSSRPISVAR